MHELGLGVRVAEGASILSINKIKKIKKLKIKKKLIKKKKSKNHQKSKISHHVQKKIVVSLIILGLKFSLGFEGYKKA